MKKIVNAIIALILGMLLCSCSINDTKKGAVYPKGTFVDDKDISGMTRDEALSQLNAINNKRLEETTFEIIAGGKNVTVTLSQLPVSFNTEKLLDEALEVAENEAYIYKTEITLDTEKAEPIIEKLTEPLNQPAVPGGSKFDNESGEYVTSAPEDGFTVNVKSIVSAISNTLYTGGIIEAATTPVKADDGDKTAFAAVSEFTTSFAKKPYNAKNRVKNIKKAAELINGTVVKAGESFDTNATLGDRNSKNGWYKAAGIRNGDYSLEYGGGVCQVLSTLYNAVLMADLRVNDRTHHSWPMGYVPIGMDATISTDGPNFIFTNTSDSDITIAAIVNEKEMTITMRILGTPLENGTRIEIESEETGALENPGYQLLTDDSLDHNEEIIDKKARRGKTSRTYKVFYDKNGKQIDKKLVSEDKYESVKGVKRVGA